MPCAACGAERFYFNYCYNNIYIFYGRLRCVVRLNCHKDFCDFEESTKRLKLKLRIFIQISCNDVWSHPVKKDTSHASGVKNFASADSPSGLARYELANFNSLISYIIICSYATKVKVTSEAKILLQHLQNYHPLNLKTYQKIYNNFMQNRVTVYKKWHLFFDKKKSLEKEKWLYLEGGYRKRIAFLEDWYDKFLRVLDYINL